VLVVAEGADVIPLGAIPWRLVGIAALIAIVGGMLWHDHHQTQRANRLASELGQAKADLAAALINTEKANAAAERFAISIENLKAARVDTPVRAVRLCNTAPGLRTGPAASRIDAASPEGLPQTPGQDPGDGRGNGPLRASGQPIDRWGDDGPDLGPELYALMDEADTCPATLEALQGWVRNR
jgi:hypothetical protein